MQFPIRKDHDDQNMRIHVIINHVLGVLNNIFVQQRSNLVLYLPICLAIGVALYFKMPFEPPFSVTLILWGLVCIVFVLSRRQHEDVNFLTYLGAGLCFVVFLIATGFTAAHLRTNMMNTPMLMKPLGPVDVEGCITSVETMEKGGTRLTLKPSRIERLEQEDVPHLIRLRLRQDSDLKVGDCVNALAKLNPPSPPVIPNGFDFRRHLYFKNIGAIGFIYNKPTVINTYGGYSLAIEGVRSAINQRYYEIMPEREAAIAAALVVGHKSGISEDDRDAVRDAGLAHILAISGLHVGLMAGAIFFIIRLSFAAIPPFALRYPIKKIAALFAIAGAFAYMMIAGATIPTQRAVLMISVVFFAIIIDRSAFTLRLVALAAFCVLLLRPESLLSASFQMSFAAVSGLVAFYDVTREWWKQAYIKASWFKKMLLYVLGVCITTVIASVVTAPFALYHFGQVSFLGSVSNLVAVPILAFLVMPAAVLSLVLMPFGLDPYAAYVMTQGIALILDIAYFASEMPAAIITIPALSLPAFIGIVMSGLVLIVTRGWLRVTSLPILVIGLYIAHIPQPEQFIVSARHKLFGYYDQETLHVSSFTADRFVREQWTQYFGLAREYVKRLPYKGGEGGDAAITCGEAGCRFITSDGIVIYNRSPYRLQHDCMVADVVIATTALKKQLCNSVQSIDKIDAITKGAHILKRDHDDKWSIETTADKGANRPWSLY